MSSNALAHIDLDVAELLGSSMSLARARAAAANPELASGASMAARRSRSLPTEATTVSTIGSGAGGRLRRAGAFGFGFGLASPRPRVAAALGLAVFFATPGLAGCAVRRRPAVAADVLRARPDAPVVVVVAEVPALVVLATAFPTSRSRTRPDATRGNQPMTPSALRFASVNPWLPLPALPGMRESVSTGNCVASSEGAPALRATRHAVSRCPPVRPDRARGGKG